MRRRFGKIGILCLGLTLCLLAVGVGYGFWSDSLTLRGTIDSGDIDCVFTAAWSDDPEIPETDDPVSTCGWNPAAQEWVVTPIGTGPYKEAFVDAYIEPGNTTLTVTLQGAYIRYPDGMVQRCYSPTVYYNITNFGSIPVKIQSIVVTLPMETTAAAVTANVTGIVGRIMEVDGKVTINPVENVTQIDPGGTVTGDLELCMTPASRPNVYYLVTVNITAWNWNEVV